jgi:hypothetical protein
VGGHLLSTSTIGRTAVVGGYVVAVALAGRPVWLAMLLALTLALVWAAPFVLAPPRRRSAVVPSSMQATAPGNLGSSEGE